jgi:large subunit ribosomal protein L25
MQINAKISARNRKEFGKQNKPLRKQNSLPGVVMEKVKPSLPVVLSFVEFTKVYKEAGETSLIDFALEGKTFKVLISEVQLHPVSLKPIHAVFRKVDLKEKLTAQVPVEITNEELNPLVKVGEAMVLKLLDEIAVEALPGDLPKEFVIDATKLINIGDEIKIVDLEYDRTKVEISEYDADEPVAKLDKVEEMKVEEEAAVVTEEEALAKVTATEELSDEEKAKREEEKKSEKQEKGDKDKGDKK